MEHLTQARDAIFGWLSHGEGHSLTVTNTGNEVEDAEIRKSLIESERFPKYYAVKENTILSLGFSLPEEVSSDFHELVGRYGLFIIRGGKNGVSVDFELLDEETTTDQAQDQAVTLVDNQKNTVLNVRVGIGVPWAFAGRPVFKGIIAFFRVSKDVEGFTTEKEFHELEKAGTVAQSILFPKDKFSVSEARTWLKSHGKGSGKVDSPANFHRFRQFDPSGCGSTPKTISFGGSGIKAIVCVKKDVTPGDVHEDTFGSVHSAGGKGGKKKKKKLSTSHIIKIDVDIFKANIDRGLIYGIVYAPDIKDTHGDHTSKEEIEFAAHNFLPHSIMNIDHKENNPEVEVVESFIAPCDFTYGDGAGDSMDKEQVTKGSWVLVTKVLDNELLESIKRGERTGYSLEGTAQKI